MAWTNIDQMTQPVQFRQSITIAVLTGAQAILPAIVAVASLYATSILFRQGSRSLRLFASYWFNRRAK
jgi:hypothetical protein